LTIDPHQFEALERFTAFLEDLKGKKEPPRAYSMASAPHEKYLAFTVKEERYSSGSTKYPPLLSPLLVKHLQRGQRLAITGFTGPYTLPEDIESKTDHLVHLCAGSGSVPNLSILKHSLKFQPKLRHTFLYSNKTWDDIIFRSQLQALAAEYPDRLEVIHALTREADPSVHGPNVRKGRIGVDLLREFIPDPSACDRVRLRPGGLHLGPGRGQGRGGRAARRASWSRWSRVYGRSACPPTASSARATVDPLPRGGGDPRPAERRRIRRRDSGGRPEQEFEITRGFLTMKDGVRLAATYFSPRPKTEGETLPTLFEFLPYRKDDSFYQRDYPLYSYFAKHGYRMAKVDLRAPAPPRAGCPSASTPTRSWTTRWR
jgi:ferredoxin-NADP reductase